MVCNCQLVYEKLTHRLYEKFKNVFKNVVVDDKLAIIAYPINRPEPQLPCIIFVSCHECGKTCVIDVSTLALIDVLVRVKGDIETHIYCLDCYLDGKVRDKILVLPFKDMVEYYHTIFCTYYEVCGICESFCLDKERLMERLSNVVQYLKLEV